MNPQSVLLFIDAIEDDEATVLLGETSYRMPRALLPEGAREGTWLRLTLADNPEVHQAIEEKRARLLGGDPGGKIKL